MPPKKINLNSSLSAMNAKLVVGKKKALPKLKVILANPCKPKYGTLTDNELCEFKELIISEVKASGMSGRLFAREKNIQLGLGSSLRAIRNKKASCVLVSRSIKPKFIIDQIVFFAKQKNSNVPVFIVDGWDEISANLFMVKSLLVVFPSNLSGELGKWISKRTLPTNEKQRPTKDKERNKPVLPSRENDKKLNLNSLYLKKPSNGSRSFVPDVVVKSEPITPQQPKDWTGDFISFSNRNETIEKMQIDMDEVDEEFKRKQDKALDALQRIAKSRLEVDMEYEFKTTTKSKEEPSKPLVPEKVPITANEEWEKDTSYISLEVHKIQPNPKRKPKNKRKNKQKMKLNEKLK